MDIFSLMVSLPILIIILLLKLSIVPLVFIIINIVKLFKPKFDKNHLLDLLMLMLSVFFLLFFMKSGRDYDEPAIIMGENIEPHAFIASWHTPTVLLLFLLGVVSIIILIIRKHNLPPIVSVLCLSAMFIGAALSVVFIIQISNHIFDRYNTLYLLFYPVNFILCSARMTRETIRLQTADMRWYKYDSRFMTFVQRLLTRSASWLIIPFLLAFPLLGVLILILMLFGQQPDAIIKAFTETSDWVLSQRISPPPIHYEGHYLCTIALKGSKRLVKPTRCGIRHGTKIVVNRQLCIANAFEQVIQEKAPRMHRIIRKFYDNHGYPLSKKINTEKSANAVYLLMKPLEWFFLLFLYTVDINPENRIALQYTSARRSNNNTAK